MKRKKILFISRWYPDRHDSMYGLFIQKHAQAVQILNDVTVLYVSADNKLPPGKVLITREYFEGIYEIKIYFGKYKSKFLNAWGFLKYYMSGIKIAKQNSGQPDLVHVNILSRTALPALWLKYTLGIPFIITEHWSRYLPVNLAKNAYTGFVRKAFTKFAVKNANAVTTVTQNLAESMKALGLFNTYYITPNVADTNLFRLSEKTPQTEIKKLIHVTCFDEPAKNLKGIINVVNRLANERKDFILEIVGDGNDFNDVKKYAEATGLVDNRIFFYGLLSGEPLAEKMRDASAMVMFSNYENLPCTIVESICCGVPVISSDVGGIKEHLLPEFGILVQAGNEPELESAIKCALDNSEVFSRTASRSYGLEHFSMNASGNLFNEIYNSVVRN